MLPEYEQAAQSCPYMPPLKSSHTVGPVVQVREVDPEDDHVELSDGHDGRENGDEFWKRASANFEDYEPGRVYCFQCGLASCKGECYGAR